MAEWPPELDELKLDLGVEDDRDDTRLQTMLDAAVAFVERVRPQFNYDADPLVDLPEPTADHVLGTLRLAGRWHTRRRAPDDLIAAAELGTTRLPGLDPDITRLLRIGRHQPPVVA